MIKKIVFGLLSVSALTMLTALPALANDDMDVAMGITPSITIDDEDANFAVPLNEAMEVIELKTDEDGNYFYLENGEKVYYVPSINAEEKTESFQINFDEETK